jgi:diguanylate cyclase (GGDEF)-like protein
MAHGHDVRLVIVAALICTVAALTVFTILQHARLSSKRSANWIALAGLVAGVGVWSTHFIAMLAYDPGVPIRYDLPLTVASAAAAIVVSGVGWWFCLRRGVQNAILSGLVVAAGICAMHYSGMAAVRLPGSIAWDAQFVAASLIASAMLSIWAVREQRRGNDLIPWRPALAFILAICSLHFIGMAAVTIVPDPAVAISDATIDRSALISMVIAGSILLVALGFFVVLFDRVGDRERAAAKIAHLAYHDALTGLSNRSVLDHHLNRSIDSASSFGQPLAVICVDLDGFKSVNDTFGHAAGDELLVKVSERLRSIVRGNDLVARVGGDEFIIVQQGGEQPDDASQMTERIIHCISEPYVIFRKTVVIGASVGVAIFPKDAVTADDLSKKADAALYQAKSAGRGVARFYDKSLEEGLRARQRLECRLAAAIREDALAVDYQPIVDLQSGSVTGFEALARWDDPELGPIEPETFVRLAEQKGLIGELGQWVLSKACADAARWKAPLTLSVNFSPVQFLQKDLTASIAAVLAETGLDPRRLEVEVTESVLISEPDQALCIFNELKQLGVRVALDDFGTGYSSLSYFLVFPFDKVKIDRSFIRDLDRHPGREIVRTIIDLARSLGISVVAEGVETIAQRELLRTFGCHQVQGYLVGRPQRIGCFKHLLTSSKQARAA